MNVVHRDLKFTNIMISDIKTLKIIDFGLAIKNKPNHLLKVICGTSHFMAPELYAKLHYDGRKSDVWAIGIIFYYMIVGKLPFKGMNEVDLANGISYDDPVFPRFVSKPIKNFIMKFLEKHPTQRFTIAEVNHFCL